MRCLIIGHESYDTCGICLNCECDLQSRLICPKCLINYHKVHLDSIILFNDILDLKQKDLDYFKIFPEIEKMRFHIEEGNLNKTAANEISTIIESDSSLILDLVHSNFDNINSELRKCIDSNLKQNLDQFSQMLNRFEEFSLFETMSSLVNKQITVKETEHIINSTIMHDLKEIKFNLSKLKNNSFSKNISQNEKIIKKINSFYADLKNDLLVIFKKYSLKVTNIIENASNSNFKFVNSSYNKNVPFEEFYKDDTYIIKGKSLCLVGDLALLNSIEKWKIVIDKQGSYSCCGFGIGSVDDPNFLITPLSSNNNNVLLCLCCNGPWSAKAMKVTNTLSKLGPKLAQEDIKEVYFELNRVEDKFKIFDCFKNLHAEINLSSLTYKDNLTPIMNCTSGVNFSFKIVIDK